MAISPTRTHMFRFNPEDNSGESLVLKTYMTVEDDNVILNQNLTLHSYKNWASMRFVDGFFTPDNLRKLADELEEEMTSLRENPELIS